MEDTTTNLITKPIKKIYKRKKTNVICKECSKSITKKECICIILKYCNENIDNINKIESVYSNCLTEQEILKLTSGEEARNNWSKKITNKTYKITIHEFNKKCGFVFNEIAEIKLDLTVKRQSTLDVELLNKKLWETKKEFIYIITLNDYIMKIGGTRDGMNGRWSSYCCGYYVSQRKNKNGKNYPGKMSVTNAYLYHTIENNLIMNTNNKWKIYVWDLPISNINRNILGEDTNIIVQTFHAYEAICIKKYKNITGSLPLLCDNFDPTY